MNTAAVVSASSTPVAYAAQRNAGADADAMSEAARAQASAAARPEGEASAPSLIGRYPSLSFVYNDTAARLVMLVRSPTTGETETQIPSEAALKLYQVTARAEERRVAGTRESSQDPTGREAGQGGPESRPVETAAVTLDGRSGGTVMAAGPTVGGVSPRARAGGTMSVGHVDVVV